MLLGALQLEEIQNKLIDQGEYRLLLESLENTIENTLKNSGIVVQDLEKFKQQVQQLIENSTFIIKQSIIKDGQFFIPEDLSDNIVSDKNNTIREYIKNFSKDSIRLKRIVNATKDLSPIKLDQAIMNNITIISNYYKWMLKNADDLNHLDEQTKEVFENAKFNFSIALSSKQQKLAKKLILSKIEDLSKIVSQHS